MTPEQLQELRDSLAAATTKREQLREQLANILRTAETESRDLTIEDHVRRGRLDAQIDAADAQHLELEDQLREAENEARITRAVEKVAQQRLGLGIGNGDGFALDGVKVSERPIYERGNGISYLQDLCVRSFGHGLGSAFSRADARLKVYGQENHQRALELDAKANRTDVEEFFLRQMIEQTQQREQWHGPTPGQRLNYRALSTGTGAGGEFVPPLFQTEKWIAFLRAGRVVANNCHHEALPDGTMSLVIPKVLSGTSVDIQAVQNTGISMTDLETGSITIPVVIVAGGQKVSLAMVERGPAYFDDILWSDLANAHAQRMDIQVLNGSGLNGQMTGILNTAGINLVTWTQGTPTLKGYYGQVALGKVDIENSIYRPATHQFITPNMGEWIGQTFDTTNRPVVVPSYNGPFNAVMVAPDNATAEGAYGHQLNGLATFKDANLPQNLGSGTNQDIGLISRMDENWLMESPIVTRALPETFADQMSVLLQLYNYAAFTAARYPTANSVITGTGMAQANRTFNS